jgi:hypothetical protein
LHYHLSLELQKLDLKGYILEPCAISSDEAFEKGANEKIDSIAYDSVLALIVGEKHFENVGNSKPLTSVRKKQVLYLPFWKAHFEYKGKKYVVIVDGQTSSRIYGEKPEDKQLKEEEVKYLGYFTFFVTISAAVFLFAHSVLKISSTALMVMGGIGLLIIGAAGLISFLKIQTIREANRSRLRGSIEEQRQKKVSFFEAQESFVREQ